METLLGWTLIGKIVSSSIHVDNFMTTISLLATEGSDLWDLDVLGIRYSIEKNLGKNC